jgi:hypothetical protein
MMGHQEGFQPKLFYHQINLEQRVPPNHTLRKIQEKIDFDFIYGEVKDTYGGSSKERFEQQPVQMSMEVRCSVYIFNMENLRREKIPYQLCRSDISP